jgi:pimeloyl-ACP methyl ester carboxylesterase
MPTHPGDGFATTKDFPPPIPPGQKPVADTAGLFSPGPPCLHYVEAGRQGPALVLLHGLSDTLDPYRKLLPILGQSAKVYALDLRGHGLSQRAASYSMADYVDDVARFITQHCTAPTLIAGHSMGALVAIRLAVTRPDLVSAIFLEDPPLYRTTIEDFNETLFYAYFTQLHRAVGAYRQSEQGLEDFAADMAQWPYGRGNTMIEVLGQQGVMSRARQLHCLDERTIEWLLSGRLLRDAPSATLLPQVRCPVHLVAGAVMQGGALFASEVKRFNRQVPQAHCTLLEDVGHNIHHENPRAYLRVIKPFLAAATTS